MVIKNHDSVLAATAIKIANGMKAHRIVLRKLDNEYVTHYENMEIEPDGETWKHYSFYWGHYFNSLDEAEKDFESRRKDFHL